MATSLNPNPAKQRKRLDVILAERALASSRSRARDMIIRGCVTVEGRVATKPGDTFPADCAIAIQDKAASYVSRAALKLVAALDAVSIPVEGSHALDLGASTGGFTQVLLERGASQVTALDVGHGQIAPNLANDPRVLVVENFNARALTASDLTYRPNMIVSDLSFISLKIAAEPALRLAAQKAHAVLLIKPQFEVGRKGVGKGGLVTDDRLIKETVADLVGWFDTLPGWTHSHVLPSPIKGADGNREFLLCGSRS